MSRSIGFYPFVGRRGQFGDKVVTHPYFGFEIDFVCATSDLLVTCGVSTYCAYCAPPLPNDHFSLLTLQDRFERVA
jgi:hypothetical protein